MTQQSGAPGADSGNMFVRGITSMESSVDPLIIVDGAPYYSSLTNINTDDIESVTVLKDAASAALYGAAGAAGVILVTTKKGHTEEAVINVDMKWGVNSRSVQDYDKITDPAQYYEAYYTMMNNYYVNAQGLDAATAHTSGIQRGRMGRCSFHTRVVIHTVPGAVDESYPGTSFTKSRVRLQVLRGGLD